MGGGPKGRNAAISVVSKGGAGRVRHLLGSSWRQPPIAVSCTLLGSARIQRNLQSWRATCLTSLALPASILEMLRKPLSLMDAAVLPSTLTSTAEPEMGPCRQAQGVLPYSG